MTTPLPLPPQGCRYPRPIILVGLRGSGKTAVGRLLARSLGFVMVDFDRQIQRAADCSIADLFASVGERRFRRLESRLLTELSAKQRLRPGEVWATGGGIILTATNRHRLRRAGLVVWLRCPARVCAARIGTDRQTRRQRPTLLPGAASPAAELVALERTRRALYSETAHITINASADQPAAVARSVRLAIRQAVTATHPRH